MSKSPIKQKKIIIIIVILCIMTGLYAISGRFFEYMGEFLIHDDLPVKSDAAIILNTGVEYYPRLVEAASTYKKGLVKKIVINVFGKYTDV